MSRFAKPAVDSSPTQTNLRPSYTFPPTPEQADVIEAFSSGSDVIVKATAGSGKSTTMEMVARSTSRVGAYAAFNKKVIADATGRMPGSLICRTAHSFAYRGPGSIAPQLQAKLQGKKEYPTPARLAKLIGTTPVTIPVMGSDVKLGAGPVAKILLDGFTQWTQSWDPEMTADHLIGEDAITQDPAVRAALFDGIRHHIEPVWDDLCSPHGEIPFGMFAVYLKAFELLDHPELPGEYLILDEAQDLAGVLISIVRKQRGKQLVVVGDSAQALYGFTGAHDALEKFGITRTGTLTTSWRYGPEVATLANLILDELGPDHLDVKGNPAKTTTVGAAPGSPVVLCRTNGAAVAEMMEAMSMGLRVHFTGNPHEVKAFCWAAMKLMGASPKATSPLSGFESWSEVCSFAGESNDAELRKMVNLVVRFGAGNILDALDRSVSETTADVIVSTAHVSKGREWDVVRLAGDFPQPDEGTGELPDEEWRLLYVAATRARERLDVTAVPHLAEMAYRAGLSA